MRMAGTGRRFHSQRPRATDEDIECALEEGWKQGVASAMADGMITRDEEERLRAFRDRLALGSSAARTRTRWPNWTAPGRTGS